MEGLSKRAAVSAARGRGALTSNGKSAGKRLMHRLGGSWLLPENPR
ncbi:hypothetical protein EDD90_2200 [Streptomyces sp. Ag109_O5-1]|nr:hypothetical protein [Streptomyces sp. Ag109_O5-1]RPE39215.1 hypothetical protein EDD90_2200 [Streptomyces sp. Ag109_O5-1]